MLEPVHKQCAFAPACRRGEQVPGRRILIVQPGIEEGDILISSAKWYRPQPSLGDQVLFEKFFELAAKPRRTPYLR